MEVTEALHYIRQQLEGGRTLNTLGFLALDGEQYENGLLFAAGRPGALEKHRAFRESVSGYSARVLATRVAGDRSFMDVHYEFTDSRGSTHSLPGLHEMQWRGCQIVREDFWVEDMYAAKRQELLGE